ncbi:hypothetical protein [Neptunomonas phycophila]|uniref:hypothetical protein n=1 Tax=Neptunomonas phycophila TaxID=1572645 RepID=UPI0035181756
MKTLTQINNEITTVVREKADGTVDITSTHIDGETKLGTSSATHSHIKACIIQSMLASRIADRIEGK